MGKFSKYSTAVQPKERPWKIHPIWRGIGCLMVVLIPIISYAGAVLLVNANNLNNWIAIPKEFIGPQGNPLLYTQLGVTVFLSLFGYMIIVILYSLLYRFIAPPQHGPLDSQPIRRKQVKSIRKR